eukprot:scaffold108495_cov105-Phaeocystis_antarctica.AAC.4
MELVPSVPLFRCADRPDLETNPGGYLSTKIASPGDRRPQKPDKNSSGHTREYGTGMLLVSLFWLPFLSLGTLTAPPGSTERPRKAGSALGTPTGLPPAARFTPVCGLYPATAPRGVVIRTRFPVVGQGEGWLKI